MPKEEWGVKRICPITGKRFYDLNANPIVSPYTGESIKVETGKGTRMMVADKADKAAVAEDLVGDAGVVLEDDEDDTTDVDLGDEVLDDEDEGDVSLEEIADVAAPDDE